jgi:hypothetical protein
LEKSKGCLEKGIPLDFHERRLGKWVQTSLIFHFAKVLVLEMAMYMCMESSDYTHKDVVITCQLKFKGQGYSSVVDCLPCISKAMCFIPNTTLNFLKKLSHSYLWSTVAFLRHKKKKKKKPDKSLSNLKTI